MTITVTSRHRRGTLAEQWYETVEALREYIRRTHGRLVHMLPARRVRGIVVPAKVRRLTRDEARRIAVRAQLLDADRPTDLLDRRRSADLPAARPDRRDRAERRPRRLDAGWATRYEPAASAAGARARPHAVRAPRPAGRDRAGRRDGAPDGRPRSVPRRHGRWPSAQLGADARWLDANDGFRRRVLEQLARLRPAGVARHPRHR